MSESKPLAPKLPKWPPAWNPFEVFLLCLSLASSVGLIHGNSGSKVLDAHLSDHVVTLWGVALDVGAVLALVGVYCYRQERTLMQGLVLERAGLSLVGVAASVYSAVVVASVPLSGARWAVSVQVGFAIACFFRAWQDHRAITRSYRIVRAQEEDSPRDGR